MTSLRTTPLLISGLFLSALIAGITWAFMTIETALITLIWQTVPDWLTHPAWYYPVSCLVGVTLLTWSQRRWHTTVVPADQTLAELRRTHTVDYRLTFQRLALALITLGFGAGVGPAAAVLSAVIALAIWLADKLRYLYFNPTEVASWSRSRRLVNLLRPTGYRRAYQPERTLSSADQRTKRRLSALFIGNGLLIFTFLLHLVAHPAFIVRLRPAHWQANQLWLLPLALLASWGLGWLYRRGTHGLQVLNQRLGPTTKLVLGAGIICLFATLTPRLLFSGQFFLGLLPRLGHTLSGGTLLLAAGLKLLFLQVCRHTGWLGGDILPVIFAALLGGFGVATFLPQLDVLFVVAVVATSLTVNLLDSLWLPGIALALFFPVNLWPVMALILIAQVGMTHILKNAH